MMRRTMAVGAVLFLSACVSTNRQSAESEIQQIESDWNQARFAGDAHRVAELLDEHWTAIHVDGRIEGKKSYVEGIASGGRHVLSIQVIAQSIRVEPPLAIVSGEVVQRGFRRGELREGRLRYTHVWVRDQSSWRMIISQATELKPERH